MAKMCEKYEDIAMAIHHHADMFYFEGSRNYADYFTAWDALKELQFNATQRYYIVLGGWKKANLLQDYRAASSYELTKVLEIAKKEMRRERCKALSKAIPNPLHREWYKEGHKSGMMYDKWEREMLGACAYA